MPVDQNQLFPGNVYQMYHPEPLPGMRGTEEVSQIVLKRNYKANLFNGL